MKALTYDQSGNVLGKVAIYPEDVVEWRASPGYQKRGPAGTYLALILQLAGQRVKLWLIKYAGEPIEDYREVWVHPCFRAVWHNGERVYPPPKIPHRRRNNGDASTNQKCP